MAVRLRTLLLWPGSGVLSRGATLKSARLVALASFDPPAAAAVPLRGPSKAQTSEQTIMTIERPMFPPRADSAESFSLQRPPGDRPDETPTGDSPKPVQSLSRRSALAGLAVIPVIGIPIAADLAADPAFALIAEKLAADGAHCEAIEAQDEAESVHGIRSDEAYEAFDRSGDACRVVSAADWRLATTPPTTLAGVAAVLRFANQIEDGGMEWPDTDAVGPEGWHYQLRATMAAAIEALIKAQAGKAVLA